MKHILIFLFAVATLAIAFVMAPSLTNPTGFVAAEDEKASENELPSFRTYTKAVCENISGFTVCHDELFANCGSFEYRLPKNEVNGNGIFDKDWEDPRKID